MYQTEVGTRRLLSTYVFGGVVGFLILVLILNTFPYFKGSIGGPVFGASAAVMAVFAAYATLNPNTRIGFVLLGSVKLKNLVIGYLVMDYLLKYDTDPASLVGHFGGAFAGFILVDQERRGRDFARWIEWFFDSIMSWFPTWFPIRGGSSRKWGTGGVWVRDRKSNKKANNQAYGNSSNESRPFKSDDDFNSDSRDNQNKLDAILDKISRHGYDHLTKEEKQFLFRQSNN